MEKGRLRILLPDLLEKIVKEGMDVVYGFLLLRRDTMTLATLIKENI